MTIPSEVNRSGPYNGNGVTKAFEYKFKIYDPAHLRVIRTAPDTTETVLTYQADYAVTGVGNDGGGNAVLAVAPAAGYKITLLPTVPFTQETDLENQGAYYAEVVERALDLGVMRDQQLQEQVNRAVKLPASADSTTLNDLVAGILRLSDSADAIDTVIGIKGDVQSVAGIAGHVQTVAANVDTITHAFQGSQDARDLAQKWASNPHGVEVQGGAFSSYHYSVEARQKAELATEITSRFAGGVSNQFLVKASSTDFDFSWVTIDTIGDMLRFNYDPQGINGDAFALSNMTGLLAIAKVSGLQAALNAKAATSYVDTQDASKVSKGGDIMDGGLTIYPAANAAVLELRAAANSACIVDFSPNGYSGDYNWRIQAQPNNNEFDVFHNGAHRFRIRNDGHVWTSAYGWLSERFADRGARVQREGGIWEFGSIDPNYNARTTDAPAPYVLVGLRSSNGTNVINLRAELLRNN